MRRSAQSKTHKKSKQCIPIFSVTPCSVGQRLLGVKRIASKGISGSPKRARRTGGAVKGVRCAKPTKTLDTTSAPLPLYRPAYDSEAAETLVVDTYQALGANDNDKHNIKYDVTVVPDTRNKSNASALDQATMAALTIETSNHLPETVGAETAEFHKSTERIRRAMGGRPIRGGFDTPKNTREAFIEHAELQEAKTGVSTVWSSLPKTLAELPKTIPCTPAGQHITENQRQGFTQQIECCEDELSSDRDGSLVFHTESDRKLFNEAFEADPKATMAHGSGPTTVVTASGKTITVEDADDVDKRYRPEDDTEHYNDNRMIHTESDTVVRGALGVIKDGTTNLPLPAKIAYERVRKSGLDETNHVATSALGMPWSGDISTTMNGIDIGLSPAVVRGLTREDPIWQRMTALVAQDATPVICDVAIDDPTLEEAQEHDKVSKQIDEAGGVIGSGNDQLYPVDTMAGDFQRAFRGPPVLKRKEHSPYPEACSSVPWASKDTDDGLRVFVDEFEKSPPPTINPDGSPKCPFTVELTRRVEEAYMRAPLPDEPACSNGADCEGLKLHNVDKPFILVAFAPIALEMENHRFATERHAEMTARKRSGGKCNNANGSSNSSVMPPDKSGKYLCILCMRVYAQNAYFALVGANKTLSTPFTICMFSNRLGAGEYDARDCMVSPSSRYIGLQAPVVLHHRQMYRKIYRTLREHRIPFLKQLYTVVTPNSTNVNF